LTGRGAGRYGARRDKEVIMPPRRRGRWTTHFGSWVASVSVFKVQEALTSQGHPVTEQAVYNWLAGATTPRIAHAVALVRMSEGRISLDDIVRHRTEVADESSGQHRRRG
jgi:hypothetical protein